MKSIGVLGLMGLAPLIEAMPAAAPEQAAELSERGIDLSRFLMPTFSNYTDKSQIVSIPSFAPTSYIETATEVVKSNAPGATFRLVTDHYADRHGIAHVRFKQTANGLDIDNADFNVNIDKDGQIISFGNSFYSGDIPKESSLSKRDVSEPKVALVGATNTLGLPIQVGEARAEPIANSNRGYVFANTKGGREDPKGHLMYFANSKNTLSLVWRVETNLDDNWLLTYVDAKSNDRIHGVVDYVSDLSTMRVYPWGVMDPTQGNREIIDDGWRLDASPFTWFGDGTATYETTKGNNAIAHTNPNATSNYVSQYRPHSPQREFEYRYSTQISDKNVYRNASVTQLFYTANYYHDLLYVLGFNEVAGNFQANNQGKGGREDDFVILNAHDGRGTNNAQFRTPPDGQKPEMFMYMFTRSTPHRDCTFAADVVLHEYTHGLSNRLTGGPLNSGCLVGEDSRGMGEGWSDFMPTALSLSSKDNRTVDKTIGAWVWNDKGGIRSHPYSTSKETNPLTYKMANDFVGPHAIGTIWATALYEVLWNIIDKHGINDLKFPEYDDDGIAIDGRFLAIQLVIQGLALQPCTPTMVSARNAILDADKALTRGNNQCEIWRGFAKRGLGEGATFAPGNRTEDFKIPADVC